MYTATQFLTYYFLGGGIHQMKNFMLSSNQQNCVCLNRNPAKSGVKTTVQILQRYSSLQFACACQNNTCFGYQHKLFQSLTSDPFWLHVSFKRSIKNNHGLFCPFNRYSNSVVSVFCNCFSNIIVVLVNPTSLTGFVYCKLYLLLLQSVFIFMYLTIHKFVILILNMLSKFKL